MKKQTTPAIDSTLSAGLRRFLYVTAAVTGAAILIVEILGAKMLAPYVGTSHFVWTAQIAVTLLSLATGYYFGGWLVDRSAKLSRLYACILVAAIYLCLTVLIRERVAYACLEYKLAIGALLTSAALFFVPLTLLATTGPFLVRVLMLSANAIGGQVGRLSAVSTLGSVAGTALIGYALIPFLPNSITMFATAGALLLVAAIYFFAWGRGENQRGNAVAGILLGLALGSLGLRVENISQPAFGEEIFRANSNFGQLQVIDHNSGPRRFYLNDFLTQNIYDPAAKQSLAMFTHMLHGLARAYTRQIDDVLCIGLGVGIVPMQFARTGARVEVAEINPAVVPLAEKFFDFDAQKLRLTIADGREFLNRSTNRFDAIILDAFLGDSSPSHLMTREAFDAMRRHLQPGGTLVMNCFGEVQGVEDFFIASLDKTLRAVFRSVRIHASGNGNVFFVATDEPEFKQWHAPDFEPIHPAVRETVRRGFDGIIQTDAAHGRVLTDDFNPVDYYDAGNRERIRRLLAAAMRN
ncbi:MAG: fused MFS/spermidine synthase [Verrucomicrobia bacterium]|nr:fused MFS/spermidine synthase [Verrucomicrobiota bacterium]